MKRSICLFLSLILCLAALFPVTGSAEEYPLGHTDIRLSVDDTAWYVFTRENIENNPELEELGISYQVVYDLLYDNQAYLYAIVFQESGRYMELFVRKKTLDSGMGNLSNYKDQEVLDLAKRVAARNTDDADCSVYKNQYKFAKLEYLDPNYHSYICEFITVVNTDNYTLTFQSLSQFTAADHREIQQIVDSIHFDVDPTVKEPKFSLDGSAILRNTFLGAAIGGIVGGLLAWFKARKNKAS